MLTTNINTPQTINFGTSFSKVSAQIIEDAINQNSLTNKTKGIITKLQNNGHNSVINITPTDRPLQYKASVSGLTEGEHKLNQGREIFSLNKLIEQANKEINTKLTLGLTQTPAEKGRKKFFGLF